MKVSICITLKNRAHLLKWCLESICRQDYNLADIEVCILDGGSNDSLLQVIDNYSDVLTIKLATEDRRKAYLPIVSNCPAASLNVLIKYMAATDIIIKTDPEIVFIDPWVISEMVAGLSDNPDRMYNARVHFTVGDNWYFGFDDIVKYYEQHYHIAEGGAFSRSKFYFLSGFYKSKFLELNGIEELFTQGVGYEDTHFREVWKNHFGNYEKEITGRGVHLWHGENQSRSPWEVANGRIFNTLKHLDINNKVRLQNGEIHFVEDAIWGNPELLSKIYTINKGYITDVIDVNQGESRSLDLPFVVKESPYV